MTYIVQDQSRWKRQKQFNFYRNFSEPFFGLTAQVNITKLYYSCKASKASIFIRYLYEIISVVNDIEEFRYRIWQDEVRVYDIIDVSATIARENETFGFSYMEFDRDYQKFSDIVTKEIARVKQNDNFKPATNQVNLIHFSSIPWVKFSGLSHARHFEYPDSIPKISTGKIYQQKNDYLMPVSVHVHHGLIDGLQVGKFFQLLEDRLEKL